MREEVTALAVSIDEIGDFGFAGKIDVRLSIGDGGRFPVDGHVLQGGGLRGVTEFQAIKEVFP